MVSFFFLRFAGDHDKISFGIDDEVSEIDEKLKEIERKIENFR